MDTDASTKTPNDGERPRVLVVEDCPDLAEVCRSCLSTAGVDYAHAATGRDALARIGQAPPAAVILDLKLPDMDGREILDAVVGAGLSIPVIVLTAHGSIDMALDAIRAGAYDFLAKPFKRERLLVTLRNGLERQRLERLVNRYRHDFSADGLAGFVGASAPMHAVYDMIERAATSTAPVFITGESGTGKELCAQAIHDHGPRRSGPFVVRDCGAIPRELVESDLFGHRRGAFTGAAQARTGAAKLADGGTLFLDEICELDPDLQAKLLRFTQTATIQPVGADRVEPVDVRLVCATNRDPVRERAAGRCRDDLYYRLNVIPIHLPPLREREDDVLLLARHFLTTHAREEGKAFRAFSPQAEAAIAAYHWPGNVRELDHAVRAAVVLHDGEVVLPAMLPPPLRALTGPGPVFQYDHPASPGRAAIRPLREIELEAIEAAVRRCGGNVRQAATLLEVSPSTIYRRRAAASGRG